MLFDLNTLAEWGDRAAETLPNSTHVVIPHATHSTVSIPCAASILSQFFTFDGDMDEVETSCLDAIAHPGW
ncbi:MAG: alpha/beta hydrolase [Pseudomonadota bacterium]